VDSRAVLNLREAKRLSVGIPPPYAASAQEDAAAREHIRDHMTAVVAAKINQPPR
jgi:hypothetical protein